MSHQKHVHHDQESPSEDLLEQALRRDARAIEEPASPERVERIVQHVRTAPPAGPVGRIGPARWGAVAAAACLAAVLGAGWWHLGGGESPQTTDTSELVEREAPLWQSWPGDPIQGSGALARWPDDPLQAEWANLRADAARFAGPLAAAMPD